jgi:Flp pilus assembly pilin Flp
MTTGASTSSPTPATASPLPAWVQRRYARAAEEDGVAMVEFALVATVLMLLVFGITQFGLALNAANDETQLAGEVARYAAVNYNPATGGQSLSAWAKAQGNPTIVAGGATICISFPNGSSNIGDPIKVVVNTTLHWQPLYGISRLVGGTIPATSTISSQAVMRLEAPPTVYSAGCV